MTIRETEVKQFKLTVKYQIFVPLDGQDKKMLIVLYVHFDYINMICHIQN